MKNFTILLLLVCFESYSQSGTIYALSESSSSPSDYELLEKDLATGQSTELYTIEEIFPIHHMAQAIINPYDNTFNIPAYGQGPNPLDTAMTFEFPYFFRIHIPTGQIQRIPIDDDVHYVEYSCRNNEFYLLGYDYNDTIFSLTKINGFNNTLTSVVSNSSISLSTYGSSSGMQSSALNQVDGHLYFHGHDIPADPMERYIYTMDVNTGAILNAHLITPASFDDIHQMAYSEADSTLYALEVNYSPNERTLVTVDPQTWATTPVSGMPHDFWYFYRNPPVIDYNNNMYSIIGAQSPSASVGNIHYFNLATGGHSESDPIFVNPSIPYYHAQECYDGQSISTEELATENLDCSSLVSYDRLNSSIHVDNLFSVDMIEVYDISGKLLKSHHKMNAGSIEIQLSDLSSQILIVNLIGKGWSCSHKLVVQ